MSHFEIVRTDNDQPFHARLVAGNGQTVMHSEGYADERDADVAVAVAAEAFGITMNRPPTRQDDPEAGQLGLIGEGPDGNVYLFDVRRIDES
jgi:uncharacterized protein YegP (UPF0339 family)